MGMQVVLYVLAAVLVAIGIAGVILPALPGVPLVFGGLLLAAWADGFQHVGWPMLTILGVLTVLSLGVDLLATAMGAKRVGASKLAVWGAVVGTVVGLFGGLLGLIFGPFLGALAGELIHIRRIGQATRVGFGTWAGVLVGTVLKLALSFAMVGLFALAWFF